MQVTTPAPTISRLAEIYRISKKHVHGIKRAYGLTTDDLTKPELVFDKLLEAGRACPLRSRLADPVERAVIVEELNISAMRAPRVPASAKIQSIH